MDSSLMSRVMILRVFDRSDNPKFGTRTYLWLSDWALASLQSDLMIVDANMGLSRILEKSILSKY